MHIAREKNAYEFFLYHFKNKGDTVKITVIYL